MAISETEPLLTAALTGIVPGVESPSPRRPPFGVGIECAAGHNLLNSSAAKHHVCISQQPVPVGMMHKVAGLKLCGVEYWPGRRSILVLTEH